MLKPVPIPLSMILCDAVQIDRATGKATLFGTFSNISAHEYPATHPEFAIFAELTDGRGEVTITLRISKTTADAVEGSEINRLEFPVRFEDPRSASPGSS